MQHTFAANFDIHDWRVVWYVLGVSFEALIHHQPSRRHLACAICVESMPRSDVTTAHCGDAKLTDTIHVDT